jgi:2-succinyl-6-hydroxy-2,4-cyclohexadiene-1-carboxylate synthase
MISALIHGFAGTPAAWDEVIAAWQHDSTPIAIALPGHGGGAVRDTWQANLDAIAIESPGSAGARSNANRFGDPINADLVVGYSLGARVALGLVASGRIARAILVGVNPGIDDAERPARRASDAVWARMLREQGTSAFADAWSAQPLFASQARVSPERLAARRTCRVALEAEQLARSLEAMGLAEMPDYRGAITADRVALVAGADDAKYVAIARQFSVSVVTVPGSGHDPTLEQPEALARLIASLA